VVEASNVKRPLARELSHRLGGGPDVRRFDVENTLALGLDKKTSNDRTHPLGFDGACTLAPTRVRAAEAADDGAQRSLLGRSTVLFDPPAGKEAHSGCSSGR
jgi:hypothetical protein